LITKFFVCEIEKMTKCLLTFELIIVHATAIYANKFIDDWWSAGIECLGRLKKKTGRSLPSTGAQSDYHAIAFQ